MSVSETPPYLSSVRECLQESAEDTGQTLQPRLLHGLKHSQSQLVIATIQDALQHLVVEVGHWMNKLARHFASGDCLETKPCLLQHLLNQAALSQCGEYFSVVAPLTLIAGPHPVTALHDLHSTVSLFVQVQAKVDGCGGHCTRGGRGRKEWGEEGRGLRQLHIVNAESMEVVEDDIATVPLFASLTEPHEGDAQLAHHPLVAGEETDGCAGLPLGGCKLTIVGSKVAALVQVSEE